MVHSRALVLLFPLLFLTGAAAAAQPIVVSGSISDSNGRPIAGAKAAVYAFESDWAKAQREFVGQPEPEPLAASPADSAGRFRLSVAEVGFYRLVVGAPGFLSMERRLNPLTDDEESEPAKLQPATEVAVRVENPDGTPHAGAWVMATAPEPNDSWRLAPRRARTGTDGVVRLPRASDETPRWLAAALGLTEVSASSRGPITMRLRAGSPMHLRVLSAQGRPVERSYALAGEGEFPLAVSGAAGELDVAAAVDIVKVVAPTGAAVQRRLGATSTGEPDRRTITLPATGSVEGRVIDLTMRQPVAGAFVWSSRQPETAVRTRADGTYLVSGLEVGMTNLRAAARGHVASAGNTTTTKAGSTVHGPTLLVVRGRRVAGVVVGPAGRGIERAHLTLRSDRRRMSRDMMILWVGDQHRASTDTAGRFIFPAVATGLPYVLGTDAEGFAPAELNIDPEPGREADLRIVLNEGLAASGLVVDSSRRPVAGATAKLRAKAAQDEPFDRSLAISGRPEAVADPSGRFRFAHLRAGRYELEVTAPGHAPVTVPGIEVRGETQVDLGTVTLLPEAIVEGVVVDRAGTPVANAKIQIGKRTGGSHDSRDPSDAESGGDGRFQLRGLAAQEPIVLKVWAKGFGPAQVPGVVPRAPEQQAPPTRVVLQVASRLAGKVMDRLRQPLSGVQISGMSQRPIGDDLWRAPLGDGALMTDDEGRFEIRDVPEGTAQLHFRAEGYQIGTLQVPVSGGKDILDLELVLQPGAVVTGRVLDASGGPVITANVSAGASASARVDADGGYRLDGVPTGRRTITAWRFAASKVSRELEVEDGENRLDLVFPPGTSVSGVVLDERGQPVADARVFLQGDNALAAMYNAVVTGQDGRFTLNDQKDGEYLISATKQALTSAEMPVTVSGGPVSGVEIRLEPGATLVGQLEGLEFAELPRARISARGSRRLRSVEGYADFAGRFRLEGLSAGEWDVWASIGDTGRNAKAHVTIPPGDTEVPVTVRFESGLALSGTVHRRDAPVSGALVSLAGQEVSDGGQATTDFEGRFQIGGLEAGTYVLEVASGGPLAHRETIAIDEDREVAIELRSGALQGRVVSAATKDPIARAEVNLWLPDASPDESFTGDSSARTDSRGVFFLDGIGVGEWRLRASAPGHAVVEREVTIAEGAGGEIEIALQPTGGVALDVRVDGEPARSGVALVIDASGQPVWDGRFNAGENGRVRLDSVPPGNFTVWIVAYGAAPIATGVVVPGPVVPIEARRGGNVTVRVPDLYEDPAVAKLTLSDTAGQPLQVPEGRFLRQDWSLAGGLAMVRSLHPGTWNLTARAGDGRVWRGTAVVPAGGGEIEVVLQKE